MLGIFGSNRNDDDKEDNKEEENRDEVTSPENCDKMAKKYGWELDRVEKTGRDPLRYDWVFKRKQTSFWDMWQEHQDAEE
ncbi:hypothetical protein [Microseira sp. BLCC-F43]|jgi:hypothetical protein|uniref:hypothetical protein n=1 Tax=Microseira sp. BLCC-F43 TaxID=3153602 RepID=UPI0035B7A85C